MARSACVFVCTCVRVVENIVQIGREGSQVSSTDFVVGGGNHRHDKRHVTMDTEEPPFISYSISLSYSLLPRSSSFVRISYTGARLTTFISLNFFFSSFLFLDVKAWINDDHRPSLFFFFFVVFFLFPSPTPPRLMVIRIVLVSRG